MNTESPDGLPQIVSFVPLAKLFVCTANPNQLVVLRFVENSGITLHVSVPVERKTMFVVSVRLRIWIVGGDGGATVNIVPPKWWMEQS
jgi:hypothetical protein